MIRRVEQGSCEFDLKRLVFEQIHDKGFPGFAVINYRRRHEFASSLSQLAARLLLVTIGFGVLHQGWRNLYIFE